MKPTSKELCERAGQLKARLSKVRASLIQELNRERLWMLVEECSSHLKDIAPIKRREWLDHVISELYHDQGGMCSICNSPLVITEINVDHLIPFSWGGGNERTNIQVVHKQCNQQKGNEVEPVALLLYLEDRYMNLPPIA